MEFEDAGESGLGYVRTGIGQAVSGCRAAGSESAHRKSGSLVDHHPT